jgi:hypothetical protein
MSNSWVLEVFKQVPPTFPPGHPSMPSRPYEYGDPVSLSEIVLRNIDTGDMVVVYPGSLQSEHYRHTWPHWEQLFMVYGT